MSGRSDDFSNNSEAGILVIADWICVHRSVTSFTHCTGSSSDLLLLCGALSQQISHTDQVVPRQSPPELGLSHRADLLGPSEHFLDALSQALAHGVARMPSRTSVDGRAAI